MENDAQTNFKVEQGNDRKETDRKNAQERENIKEKNRMTKGTMTSRIGGGYQKNVTKIKIGLQWVQSVLIGVQSVKNLHSQHSDLYLHKKGQDEQFCMPVFFVVLGAFLPFVKPSRFSSGCRFILYTVKANPPLLETPLCTKTMTNIFKMVRFVLFTCFFSTSKFAFNALQNKIIF